MNDAELGLRTARSAGTRRLVDQLSLIVLAGALGLVAVVAIPAVILGTAPASVAARRGIERALRERGWVAGAPTQDEAPDGLDGLAEPDPDDPLGGRRRVARTPDDGPDPADEELRLPPGHPPASPAGSPGRPPIGRAIELGTLRMSPDAAGEEVGSVRPGDSIIVAKRDGRWLLVVVERDGDMNMGWIEDTKVRLP